RLLRGRGGRRPHEERGAVPGLAVALPAVRGAGRAAPERPPRPGLPAAGPRHRPRRLGAARPAHPRRRAERARAQLRAGRPRLRRLGPLPDPPAHRPPDPRPPAHPGHPPRASVHPRRGDPLVPRTGRERARAELGKHAGLAAALSRAGLLLVDVGPGPCPGPGVPRILRAVGSASRSGGTRVLKGALPRGESPREAPVKRALLAVAVVLGSAPAFAP